MNRSWKNRVFEISTYFCYASNSRILLLLSPSRSLEFSSDFSYLKVSVLDYSLLSKVLGSDFKKAISASRTVSDLPFTTTPDNLLPDFAWSARLNPACNNTSYNQLSLSLLLKIMAKPSKPSLLHSIRY